MVLSTENNTSITNLPDFLGIGASKCGSTWIHEILKTHPHIYMPTRRKEVNYFNLDTNYEKGKEWYQSYFPDLESASGYQAIGEFTPRYLCSSSKSAKRIAELGSVEKLILILRNPVDRAFSQYCHSLRAAHYTKPFEDYLIDRPSIISEGFYAKNLLPFLEYYDRELICCLIFETAIKNVAHTKVQLASFLAVDPSLFAADSGSKKANKSYLPKYKFLNYWAAKANRLLVKQDLDWVINLADSIGIRKFLQSSGKETLPTMSSETRTRLLDLYSEDVSKLEQLLDLDLSLWRK